MNEKLCFQTIESTLNKLKITIQKIKDSNALYIVPEDEWKQKNEIAIQPKVSHSVEQPINAIASFVNNILEPLIDAVIHTSFTFSSAVGTIRELEKYAKKGALQPTTYFVKIDIHDLTTTLPHHLLIETLKRFLQTYLRSEEMDGIPITTIVQLVQLLLENQFYTYENKLYHQTIGGSISSSLIKDFLRSKHINIQMTTTIGSTIEYLDAHISNDQGILKTKVYHDTNLEPYAMPYILNCNNIKSNDHDILMFGALARALLYCYNIDEFNSER
ncbi:unnamed protein product [Adineta ricciae]|nr:unnamed protein product [Adineta ricciae]